VLWVGDFTYMPYRDDFIYLATALDVYSREVVGWHIGFNHTTSLVIEAFLDAAARVNNKPVIFHSDQGSEYISGEYEKLLETMNIKPSHSKKSSPWKLDIKNHFMAISSLNWAEQTNTAILENCAKRFTSRSIITIPASYTRA
jgi:putative transposase